VTDTVKNQSVFPAGASRTQYYLSLDTVKNGGDGLLGGRPVPSLAPGVASTATIPVTILAGTPVGNYFVLACADDTSAVIEADETNNCLASATTVAVSR
jgi:subtilase family serine protease